MADLDDRGEELPGLEVGLGAFLDARVTDRRPESPHDLVGVYDVETHEAVKEPLTDDEGEVRDPVAVMQAHGTDVERRLHAAYRSTTRPPTPPRACARVRIQRPRARERRPGCRTRRSPRASRAGPSGDPDSSEPGEPEPPPFAGPIIAGVAS